MFGGAIDRQMIKSRQVFGGLHSSTYRSHTRTDRFLTLASQGFVDHLRHRCFGQADQDCGHTQRHHIGTTTGYRLGDRRQIQLKLLAAGRSKHRRRLAVTDHQAVAIQGDFGGEPIGIFPVDPQQNIIALLVRLHRLGGQTQHRCRLATADLRPR